MESPVLWLSCSLQQRLPAWRDVSKRLHDGVWGHLIRDSHNIRQKGTCRVLEHLDVDDCRLFSYWLARINDWSVYCTKQRGACNNETEWKKKEQKKNGKNKRSKGRTDEVSNFDCFANVSPKSPKFCQSLPKEVLTMIGTYEENSTKLL